MSKDLSAKYYQDKKKPQKKACERLKSLEKDEKVKRQQYICEISICKYICKSTRI